MPFQQFLLTHFCLAHLIKSLVGVLYYVELVIYNMCLREIRHAAGGEGIGHVHSNHLYKRRISIMLYEPLGKPLERI
ncbi:hypothetical protein TFUB20_01043 [Tannerella forsythia]|uniref:Uncharacterized protein n=1 Tax=Tannerella forsythia TaxID=28112 RepID=A0A1D3UJV0_TANFO|nr:hypothetical protein TFUB20_01043 [Tannerella forsythia]